MSWNISEEEGHRLLFSRDYPELGIFVNITLDHLDPAVQFYGEAFRHNDDIASCTGTSFHSVLDRLLNLAEGR